MARILFLSGRDVTAYGSIGRVHPLLKQLSSQHEIVIFNTRHYWKWKTRSPSQDYKAFLSDISEIVEGYPIRHGDAYINEALNLIPNFFKINQLLNRGNFDLIINYNYLFFELIRLTRRVKQPVIFEVADYMPEMVGGPQHSRLPLGTMAAKTVNYLMDAGIRNSDLVIVNTKLLGDYAQKTGARDVKLLSNGVNLDAEALKNLDRTQKRQACGLKENDLVLGSIGSIWGPVKFGTAMRAVKHLNEQGQSVKLLIGGDGVSLPLAKEEAAELNIEDKVIFLGRVPFAERFDYMAAMDICLLPYEISPLIKVTRPLKLFEYMAVGKPVLSTPIPEVQRLFPETEFPQITYANDVDTFVASVNTLLNRLQKPEVHQAIEKAKKLVYEQYTWNIIFEEYAQIITSTLDKRHNP